MNQFDKPTSWPQKFAVAFSGIWKGIVGQRSFYVHAPVAVVVIGLSWLLELEQIRFLLLLICISTVVVCELMNSSLEKLAAAITDDYNEHVRDALDIASGAVLVAAIFASIVGICVLLPPMLNYIAS